MKDISRSKRVTALLDSISEEAGYAENIVNMANEIESIVLNLENELNALKDKK